MVLAAALVIALLPAASIDTRAADDALEYQTIDAGSRHSLAIKKDGSLWFWGYTYSGEEENILNYSSTPTKIIDDVVSVRAGADFSLAIKPAGSLWAWGNTFFGQVGNGTEKYKSTPVKIMDNVASVSAGGGFSLAIKTDGSLWAWAVITSVSWVTAH